MTRTYDDLMSHPVIARAIRLGRRLRGLDAVHRWALDGFVVAVVVILMCVPDLLDLGQPAWLTSPNVAMTVALQAGLVVPLYWRRRHPVAVFAMILAVFSLQWAVGILLRADVALLIAIYNLALRAGPRQLVWAGTTVTAAMTLVAVRVSDLASPASALAGPRPDEPGIGDALVLAALVITGPAALAIAARLRRAQLAVLRERAARLEAEQDQRAQLATATERNRIAREMHDVVGHNLSVIITLADGGAYASTVHPDQGTRALQLIAGTGRQALADLRHVLGMLRDSDDAAELAPQPGLSSIGALCDQIRAAGPQVTYRTSGSLEGWDQGLQRTAYRIVQEAMTNSLRHAGPRTRIDLRLDAGSEGLRITVRDTGPPDGKAAAFGGPGQGLIGMRERAALYQGSVTAGPDPRGGWTVVTVLCKSTEPAESSVS